MPKRTKFRIILISLFIFYIFFLLFSWFRPTNYPKTELCRSSYAVHEVPVCSRLSLDDIADRLWNPSTLVTNSVRITIAIVLIIRIVDLARSASIWHFNNRKERASDPMRKSFNKLFTIILAIAVIWSIEQIVFKQKVCFGLSCPYSTSKLFQKDVGPLCCRCWYEANPSGKQDDIIDMSELDCQENDIDNLY